MCANISEIVGFQDVNIGPWWSQPTPNTSMSAKECNLLYGEMANNAKVVNSEIGELAKLQIDGELRELLNFVFL